MKLLTTGMFLFIASTVTSANAQLCYKEECPVQLTVSREQKTSPLRQKTYR